MTMIQRPTLSDVAKMAGVSVATASRALSNPDLVAESTRKAVQDAAKSCGYKVNLVARSLRMQRTNTLLVLAPSIEYPLYPALVRAIEEKALEKGYSVIMGFTLKSAQGRQSYADLVSNGRVDGMVVVDGGADINEVTGPRPAVPAIQALDMVYEKSVPAVRVDDRLVSKLAVDHLASLGHRRIGHIAGSPNATGSNERQQGFRDAMAEKGLDVSDELVKTGDCRREAAAEAMRQLLSLPERPTAVFCSDDTMACAAMDVCRQHGLSVPQDISFVGAGNTPDGEFACAPLTTVDVPRHRIGSVAAEKLIRLIQGQGGVDSDTVLPVELLVRSSTAAMKPAA